MTDNDAIMNLFSNSLTVTGAYADFTVKMEDLPAEICSRATALSTAPQAPEQSRFQTARPRAETE